jgi:hypothetical protein
MGFLEKAKLNVVKRHWIQVGEERERERIIHILEEMQKDKSGINLKGALALLKGKYGNLK